MDIATLVFVNVEQHTGFGPEILRGRRRNRPIFVARSMFACVMRDLFPSGGVSTVDIGMMLGGKDHTSILHQIRRGREMLRRDPTFKSAYLETLEVAKKAMSDDAMLDMTEIRALRFVEVIVEAMRVGLTSFMRKDPTMFCLAFETGNLANYADVVTKKIAAMSVTPQVALPKKPVPRPAEFSRPGEPIFDPHKLREALAARALQQRLAEKHPEKR